MALVLLFLAVPASAQTVTITDGDTIKIGDTTLRLWGIDAPESRQVCDDGWAAGQEAARTLRTLMQGRRLECQDRGKDRYGATLALCTADGTDLSAAMVIAGMAWAYLEHGRAYVDHERDARNARKGVHDHPCLLPWVWREQRH